MNYNISMARLFALLYYINGSLLAFYALSLFTNIVVFLFLKRDNLSKPDPLVEWPDVTIELPFYNESRVVDRVLRAVVNQDYPKEKLQIIILDDSTDVTSRKIDEFIASPSSCGFDIHVMRRNGRFDYKTGALRESMKLVRGEFIGVFDADFVPARDFLKNVIPHFACDPRIAFIQARWSYINPNKSLVTFIQSVSLDIHFILEKPVEQKLGLFINYNGSAGVWRKTAIEDCGGWPHSVLSEDLDISYYAQTRGWKALYLPEVAVPSELISSIYLLGLQQERWSFGGLQVFRKLWRKILAAKFAFGRKFHALSILSGYCIFIMIIFELVIFSAFQFYAIPVSELSFLLPIFSLILVNTMAAFVALMKTDAEWRRRIIFLPAYIFTTFGFSIQIGWGAIKGLLGLNHEFVRTPKFGESLSNRSDTQDISLKFSEEKAAWQKWLGYAVANILLSIYLLFGSLAAQSHDFWLSALVLLFLGLSFLTIALMTVFDVARINQWR